jgi:hypothetical protein
MVDYGKSERGNRMILTDGIRPPLFDLMAAEIQGMLGCPRYNLKPRET